MLFLAPLLAYAALPVALRFIVPEMLTARGLPATIGFGYLDLWKLELVLTDLRIGPPPGPTLTFAEFRASLVREALARGRIELTNLRLSGASFDIEDLSAARLPDGGDNAPFEQVRLTDLHLADLSRKLGRDVVVRHALLARDVDAADGGVRLEVDLDAAGAPMEVRGTLHDTGGVQTLAGTLSATGLPARLLDPAAPDRTSTWSGSIHAACDFELRFEGSASRASLRAVGSMHTAGVDARLGNLELMKVDSIWEGTLTLSGPAFGRPERVYFQGTLDAREARAGLVGSASSAIVSGLHWEGIGGWHGVPVAAGEGEIDAVELQAAFPGTGPILANAQRIRLKATLDDAGRYRLERLRIRDLQAAASDHGVEVRLESLETLDLHAKDDGVLVDRVSASTLEALAESDTGSSIWMAELPVLNTIAAAPGAGVRIGNATLESLGLRSAKLEVAVLGAQMEGIRFAAQRRIDVGLATFDTLEHRDDEGREVNIRDFRSEALAVDRDGAWEAAALRAVRISGAGGEGESWIAYGLEAGGVRHRSGATGLREADLESLVYRAGSGEALDSTGLHARSLEVHPERGNAETLQAEAIDYRAPDGVSWAARALSLTRAQWLENGSRSAARSVSAELRHRGAGGERWRFDSLQLGSATVNAEGLARIEGAASRRTALALSTGESLEAAGLRFASAERASSGTLRLSGLEIDALDSRALSGLAWRALPVEAESLTIQDDGQVEARRLRSASMSLDDGQGGRWRTLGIQARRLAWDFVKPRLEADPLELERLEFAATAGMAFGMDFLRAGALEWSPGRTPDFGRASATTLEGTTASGLAFRIEGLTATGDARSDPQRARLESLNAGAGLLRTESGSSRLAWSGLRATGLEVDLTAHFESEDLVFDDVSIDEGSGSRALFTATRIEVGDLHREGERLAAESVTVVDSLARLGVRETGEWKLPAWPSATPAKPRLAMEIGEFKTAGHNRAAFFDRSAEPPFEMDIEPYRLRVTGFGDPTPQRVAFLEVEGSLDASARLDMRGELDLRGESLDARVRLRLDGLELDRLTHYAQRHLGVAVRAGRGDLDVDVGLSRGDLDVTGELTVRNVTLDPASSTGAAGESFAQGIRQLAAPSGRIDLQVSVRGPIADPEFDFPAAAARALAHSAGLAPATAGENLPSLNQ